jgi:hypothetical protein
MPSDEWYCSHVHPQSTHTFVIVNFDPKFMNYIISFPQSSSVHCWVTMQERKEKTANHESCLTSINVKYIYVFCALQPHRHPTPPPKRFYFTLHYIYINLYQLQDTLILMFLKIGPLIMWWVKGNV